MKPIKAKIGDLVLFQSNKTWMIGKVSKVGDLGIAEQVSFNNTLDGKLMTFDIARNGTKFIVKQSQLTLPVMQIVNAAPMWDSFELAKTWLERLRKTA